MWRHGARFLIRPALAKLTRFNSLDPLAEGQPVFSAGTSRAGEERDSGKRTMGVGLTSRPQVEMSAPKNIAAGPLPPPCFAKSAARELMRPVDRYRPASGITCHAVCKMAL